MTHPANDSSQHGAVKEEEDDETDEEEWTDDGAQQKMTGAEATFAMANYVMNFGIFSVPVVFARTGYAAVLLIAMAGGSCMWTARLLGLVFEQRAKEGAFDFTYKGTALVAGGPVLAALVHVMCLLGLATFAWGNLIVLAQTLSSLVPGLSLEQVIVGSTVLAIGCSAIPDKAYAYVALCSAIAILTSCSIVLLAGWQLPEWAQSSRVVGDLAMFPTSLSMLIFGAACHPCLPSIYANVATRADYELATRNGWLLWIASGCVLGAAAFFFFGDAAQDIVTLNIGKDLHMRPLPGGSHLATFSAACVVLKMQGSQVPVTRPFTEALADLLGLWLPRGKGGLRCLLCSAPPLLGVAVGAYALMEKIALLEVISACFLVAGNAFIFPAFAYLRVCRPSTRSAQWGANAAIAFGVCLAISVSSSYM